VVELVAALIVVVCPIFLPLLPLSLPMFQSEFEVPTVLVAVTPGVGAVAFWFSFVIVAFVHVPVAKVIFARTLSQTFTPLSLVFVAVSPLMYPEPVCLVFGPLTCVAFSIKALPGSVPPFHPASPFSLVLLPCAVCISSIAFMFVISKFANVKRIVRVSLATFAISFVRFPRAFINSTIFIDHYA